MNDATNVLVHRAYGSAADKDDVVEHYLRNRAEWKQVAAWFPEDVKLRINGTINGGATVEPVRTTFETFKCVESNAELHWDTSMRPPLAYFTYTATRHDNVVNMCPIFVMINYYLASNRLLNRWQDSVQVTLDRIKAFGTGPGTGNLQEFFASLAGGDDLQIFINQCYFGYRGLLDDEVNKCIARIPRDGVWDKWLATPDVNIVDDLQVLSKRTIGDFKAICEARGAVVVVISDALRLPPNSFVPDIVDKIVAENNYVTQWERVCQNSDRTLPSDLILDELQRRGKLFELTRQRVQGDPRFVPRTRIGHFIVLTLYGDGFAVLDNKLSSFGKPYPIEMGKYEAAKGLSLSEMIETEIPNTLGKHQCSFVAAPFTDFAIGSLTHGAHVGKLGL